MRRTCALLVAAGLGAAAKHALTSLLAVNGLRVSVTGTSGHDCGLHSGLAAGPRPGCCWDTGAVHELTLPPGSPLQVFTAEERPDLWAQANDGFAGSWPEYNMQGNHTAAYFGELVPRFARFQVLVYDRSADRVNGRGRSIPLRWDGTLADLPPGIDAAGLRAVTERAEPTAVSALAAEVEGDQQGRGLSRVIIEAMAAAARREGLAQLIAPGTWAGRLGLSSA